MRAEVWDRGSCLALVLFCFLKNLSGMRMLTTFHVAKNDHRWVTFISLKTINASRERPAAACAYGAWPTHSARSAGGLACRRSAIHITLCGRQRGARASGTVAQARGRYSCADFQLIEPERLGTRRKLICSVLFSAYNFILFDLISVTQLLHFNIWLKLLQISQCQQHGVTNRMLNQTCLDPEF